MFEDFTRDLRIREQRERQETRKKRMVAFKDCLMDAGVAADTLWRKFTTSSRMTRDGPVRAAG